MTDWFGQPLTTLAFLWRVERADGVAIGFTSHDRDLVRGGFAYRAAPGMVPSSIRLTDGFDVDDVELNGALTSGAFTEDDLRVGRWDGARLTLSAADWTDPAATPQLLIAGSFGSVTMRDGSFGVALRGVASVFDRPVSEETSPACRATLGDPRCRVDMAARQPVVMALAVAGAQVTVDTAAPDGLYNFGTLRWTEGPLAGVDARILSSAGTLLTLAEPPASIALPARVFLREGCDRQLSTCRDRFANVVNFRGEPHLPGNDLLTRYGG